MTDSDIMNYNSNLNQGISQYFSRPGDDGARVNVLNPNWRNPLDKNKLTAAFRVKESPQQEQMRLGGGVLSNALLQNIMQQGFQNIPNQLDFSKINELPDISQFEPQAQAATQAAFQRQMNLLNPEFQKQDMRSEQSLANKGLPMGSEARDQELARIAREQNEAKQQVSLASDAVGRQEAQRLLANAMGIRQQQVQDQLSNIDIGSSNRQQILAELGGLTGLQFNQPQRAPTMNQGASNAINQGYQNQLAAYNQGQSGYGGLGALFGGVGTGLGGFLGRKMMGIPF